jgi:hypothetical protein
MHGVLRRRRLVGAALAATLSVMGMASSAVGVSPQPVTFESTMDIGGDFNTGTFTRTSGSDLICEGGTVVDTRYVWGASHGLGGNPNGLPLQVDKTFDCGDGLLYLRLKIQGVFVSEVFSWVVLGGTGAYSGLRGHGTGWTDASRFDECTCVVNYYSGFLIG